MTINSWESYKAWVSATVKTGAEYYFRGQQNPDWKLQTSFHRYAENTKIDLLDYLDRIIPEVEFYISAYKNEAINLEDNIQLSSFLAKLQHHGFPTPLLDWTLSPYIAAYFALKDIDSNKPVNGFVKIHIFDYKLWSSSFTQPLDLKSKVEFVSAFRPLAQGNPRMIRQMAVTTATNVPDCGLYLLSQGTKMGKAFLYEASIPISERKLIMNDLNLMGINSMTMFPDFDGICSSMKEQFFNNSEIRGFVPPPPK